MPRRRLASSSAVLALALLAGCGSSIDTVEAADAAPSERTATSTPAAPDGWRWESYRNVEIAVPGDWVNFNGSQRMGQWCVDDNPEPTGVGRPGISTTKGCGAESEDGVDPGALIAENGVFAAFEDVFEDARGEPPDGPVTEGDRVSVVHEDVRVSVQAEPELRDRILATVRTIEVDANGCAVTDEVSRHPEAMPGPSVAVESLTGVESVAACRYDVEVPGRPIADGVPTLRSSLRLAGSAAADALAAVAAAPAAGGQDQPESCLFKYGEEMVVLLVRSAAGPSRIHVRFSGCDHNGVDDGVRARRLNAAAHPFLEGPNRPSGWSGGEGKIEAIAGRPDAAKP